VRVDKDELRDHCWQTLRDARVIRSPRLEGTVPDFVDAERAAERLTSTSWWGLIESIKCNSDAPQRAIRHEALRAGKLLYVGVPKLADERPFIAIDPETLDDDELWHASSFEGARELGELISPDDMEPIDLLVTGSVAVTENGARLGEGGGYGDLEYALLRAYGLIDEDTPIVTTVHERQVLSAGSIPMEAHDISIDWIFTPARTIECERRFDRPSRVYWDELDEQRLGSIPVLRMG
jgi:5-formyltetrahydrofolate cyclo-ligase